MVPRLSHKMKEIVSVWVNLAESIRMDGLWEKQEGKTVAGIQTRRDDSSNIISKCTSLGICSLLCNQ